EPAANLSYPIYSPYHAGSRASRKPPEWCISSRRLRRRLPGTSRIQSSRRRWLCRHCCVLQRRSDKRVTTTRIIAIFAHEQSQRTFKLPGRSTRSGAACSVVIAVRGEGHGLPSRYSRSSFSAACAQSHDARVVRHWFPEIPDSDCTANSAPASEAPLTE